MATNHWRCSACLWLGPTADVPLDEDKAEYCPICKSEDVFPYRVFFCFCCGNLAEQDEFFGETDLDMDPTDPKYRDEYRCQKENDYTYPKEDDSEDDLERSEICDSASWEQWEYGPELFRGVKNGD
jgi:hypothetical protein